MNPRGLAYECAAELLETYVRVVFGVGAVQAAVLTGAQSGIWQVGVVWAVALALAIYDPGLAMHHQPERRETTD